MGRTSPDGVPGPGDRPAVVDKSHASGPGGISIVAMSARRITLLFLLFGVTWILTSDRMIGVLTQDAQVLSQIQSGKGIAFVCLSAMLIYGLVRRAELRRAELERRTRTQRDHLARILDVSPAVIYALHRPAGSEEPWKLDFMGRQMKAITGYPPQAWRDATAFWFEHVHPEDRAAVVEAEARLVREGQVQHLYRFLAADGRYRWISDKAMFQPGDAQQPDWMVGAWTDVTEQRLLEERAQLITRVFDASYEGIFITDPQARFLSVNGAFTRITGYAMDELVGQTPRILKSGRQDRDFYSAMWAQIHSEGRWVGEIWNRRKNGELYPENLTISAVTDAEGRVLQYLGVFTETTQTKEAEARIEHLVNHDPLTDLPSRTLLADRARVALASARRHESPLVVMHLNIDHFSRINESLGHEAGDAVIKQVARRLVAALRPEDTLCRLGRDDFVLLLPGTSEHEVAPISLRLMESVAPPMTVGGQELGITMSTGVAIFPENGGDFAQLSQAAETAVHRAKREGRNTVRVASPDMQHQVSRELAVARDLRWAVERGELLLHYQPQFELSGGRLVGLEALVRWQHPSWGLVPPGVFIPLAEESGLIRGVGEWVLGEALRQTAQWKAEGLAVVPVAVNLSVAQFRQPELAQRVREALEAQGLPASLLELELTESVAMENSELAVERIADLKTLGLALSIDDFGTGYSSLSYLKRYAVDKLKIDRSFISGVTDDVQDAAIVRTIIALAQSLRLQTLAEGVETPGQLEFLRQAGCDQAQGYLLARPLPAEAVRPWLEAQQAHPSEMVH